MKLTEMRCVPCRGGVPTLTGEEIAALMPQVPDWAVMVSDDIPQLQRVFKFKDYLQGAVFAHQVAEMADQEDHHPVIVVEWRKVTVTWWTHKIKGLHQNDFISVAKTDDIYRTIEESASSGG